jgi:S-formylglutathione hydrolase FrmB
VAQAARPAQPPPGIEVTYTERVHDRFTYVGLRSTALASPTSASILLPNGYRRSKRRYPVLYLLHGGGQYDRSWIQFGNVGAVTRNRNLIVVMPNGGVNGFYTDWWNGGAGGPPQWETFHVNQLLGWVDSRFRTIPRRRARAIAGISMGGFGALSYSARHPELFGFAASFSGVVDTNYPPFVEKLERAATTPSGEPAIWGPRETNEANWRAHNPVDLAANLRDVVVELRTGNGQPGGPFGGGPDELEQTVHAMNVSLHQTLVGLGIPHVFEDRGPGIHSMVHAQRDLASTLPGLMRFFKPVQQKRKKARPTGPEKKAGTRR